MNLIRLKDTDKLLELKINYHALFHSWIWLFQQDNFLESDYMNNLMAFLYIAHRDLTPPIRPSIKTDIFKPFEKCSIDSCNIVFVTEYPTTLDCSSGIGVGNKNSTSKYKFSDELCQFRDAIEDNLYKKKINLAFDHTLEDPSDNGILFLNSALTCTSEDNTAHAKYWNKFMTHFLTKFQEATSDKIFVFIGHACKYVNLIDRKYHTVIKEKNSLYEAVQNGTRWETKCFSEMHMVLDAIDPTIGYYDDLIL